MLKFKVGQVWQEVNADLNGDCPHTIRIKAIHEDGLTVEFVEGSSPSIVGEVVRWVTDPPVENWESFEKDFVLVSV